MMRRRLLAVMAFLAVAMSLRAGTEVSGRPGWFGIGFSYSPPLADGHARQGWLTLQVVAKGSPAERAGLRASDLIVAIDGKPLVFSDEAAVMEFFSKSRPGIGMKFAIRRGDQARTVDIVPVPMNDEQFALFQKSERSAKRSTKKP